MNATISDWIAPRRPIIKAIGLGNLTFVAVLAAAYLAVPPVVLSDGIGDRLGFALELLAGPGVVTLIMVTSCMRLFDTPGAEESPLAGNESRAWKINQRVVQNTVEQAWIFVPGLLALAVRLDATRLAILP